MNPTDLIIKEKPLNALKRLIDINTVYLEVVE